MYSGYHYKAFKFIDTFEFFLFPSTSMLPFSYFIFMFHWKLHLAMFQQFRLLRTYKIALSVFFGEILQNQRIFFSVTHFPLFVILRH